MLFADGFEYGECSLWSASSNPFGAPDTDLDLYGDELQPTVYCQLPAGCVANWRDYDPLIDEDFILNDNPLCSSGQFYLGQISGDTGSNPTCDP